MASPESRVVAFFRFNDQSFLLEGVGKVAVGVREVGLQLDGAAVRVDGQVDQAAEQNATVAKLSRNKGTRVKI